MRYRPEIDGLRALAVLPVVLYHAHVPGLSGGFVGVDVFFVISGYLITAIVCREIDEGRFSMASFYERRARRLLPPLVVMCAATFPFAWAWMFPEQFSSYARSLLAVNLFSSNILFWSDTNYFDTSADLKPLLHTWSLAVEEQFYFVFPTVLLIAARFRRRATPIAVGLLTMASFGLSVWLTDMAPSANFYLLPARAWEMGVGALIAIGMRGKAMSATTASNLAASFGLALLVLAMATYDTSVAFPGVNALVPVLGTVLIVVFAVPGTFVAAFLSWRPLVVVGLLSYSLYLWHQPVLVFARIRTQGDLGQFDLVLLVLLSVGLAYLSWRFVEQPFRDRSRWSRPQIFSMAFASGAVLAAAALAGILTGGFPGRIDSTFTEIAATSDDRLEQFEIGCPVDTDASFDPTNTCVNGDSDEVVVLWGDSHAVALAPALTDRLNGEGKAVKAITTLGCTPVIGYEWQNKPFGCTEKVTQMRQYLLEATSPGDLVIVHGHWTLLLSPTRFDNGEGGVESSPIADPILNHSPDLRPPDRAWTNEMTRLLQETIGAVIDEGRRVLVVYPVPEAGWHVPDYLARERLYGRPEQDDVSISYDLVQERLAPAYTALDSLGSDDNLARVYPADLFCNSTKPGRCLLSSGGQPLYRDDDHLSNAGADLVATLIVRALQSSHWI